MLRRKILREVFVWLLWIIFAMALARFLNAFVIVNAHVLTGSMEPTIMAHHRVFGLRTSYIFSEPARGDIIVFESPLPEEYSEAFIKRVVGLPGDVLAIISGITHINGIPLPESYIKNGFQEYFGPIEIPENAVFVMGDNRRYSRDSREWGILPLDSILGRIYFDFSPLPNFIANYVYAVE